MDPYDMIVLGAGSGRLAAARRGAEHGAKVALFDPAYHTAVGHDLPRGISSEVAEQASGSIEGALSAAADLPGAEDEMLGDLARELSQQVSIRSRWSRGCCACCHGDRPDRPAKSPAHWSARLRAEGTRTGAQVFLIPIPGIGRIMCEQNTKAVLTRINRIEGQVRGVGQMVADDRYCIDILNQVHAIKAALAKVETEILKSHAACCVEEAISSGDAAEQRKKFTELVEIFAKAKL